MVVTSVRPVPAHADRAVVFQGNWEQFKLVQQGCAQAAGVRISYFDGAIEILMPGQLHEIFSRMIAWMLTYFLTTRRIPFVSTGSMTQERAGVVSAQADESYCVGELKDIPDLSIEVVFSSGGVRKLERYAVLGVKEVWFWEDGVLVLYGLGTDGYEEIQQSRLPGLAELDVELLQRCVLMAETDSNGAIETFMQGI
jgi:Uma2 family endonuclease